MKIKNILLSLCSVILLVAVYAQDHSSFPVDVTSGPSPYYFTAGNRLRLCYELHLVNYAPFSVLISQLRIADRTGKIVALLDSNALNDYVVGADHILNNDADTAADKKLIKPGMAAIIFVDITLPQGSETPFVLAHRFRFNFRNSAGKEVGKEMPGPPMSVHRRPAISISPPVRGRSWIAFNAYGGGGHRRSYNPVDGRLRIAERFAIDFMKAGSDDRLFKTDPAINSNFYGYSQLVLAVADATVVEIKDGEPDRNKRSRKKSRHVGQYCW